MINKKNQKLLIMKRKNVTLKLKDERFQITLLGEEKHLNQITNKIKEIRFYCLGSEMRILTSDLVEVLKKEMENKEFQIENTTFAKNDVGSTFFFLREGNGDHFFVLNNNELRIPLKRPTWNILETYYEWAIYCNTAHYHPEEEFELIIV